MPGGDRTGPLGQGPLTGRRMGFCAGFNTAGFMNPKFGRGFGRGFGAGFGRGFVERPILTEADEKKILEQELKELELDKKEIEKRLKELK